MVLKDAEAGLRGAKVPPQVPAVKRQEPALHKHNISAPIAAEAPVAPPARRHLCTRRRNASVFLNNTALLLPPGEGFIPTLI